MLTRQLPTHQGLYLGKFKGETSISTGHLAAKQDEGEKELAGWPPGSKLGEGERELARWPPSSKAG